MKISSLITYLHYSTKKINIIWVETKVIYAIVPLSFSLSFGQPKSRNLSKLLWDPLGSKYRNATVQKFPRPRSIVSTNFNWETANLLGGSFRFFLLLRETLPPQTTVKLKSTRDISIIVFWIFYQAQNNKPKSLRPK